MKKAASPGLDVATRDGLTRGVPVRRIAQDCGTTPTNMHRWLRQHRIGKDGMTIEETDAVE